MRKHGAESARAAGYLLLGLPTGLASLLLLPVLVVAALSCLLGIGVVLLPRALTALHSWAGWHQRRAGRLLDAPAAPDVPMAGGGNPIERLRRQVTDPVTRRDLRWLLAHIGTSVPFGLIALLTCGLTVATVPVMLLWWVFPDAVGLNFLVLPVEGWGSALGLGVPQVLLAAAATFLVAGPLARAHARLCLAALAPSAQERLARRVDTLAETRANVLDAHGAELRRIERDLHDGAQARLVALSMRLGLARETDDPETIAKLLAEAHGVAEDAMVELRDVVRTMYPPILADRGLSGALQAMGASAGVPVQLDLDELGPVPAAVEAAAYFVVAEALTNVAKHSRATSASVRVQRRPGDLLLVRVADDGVGNADEGGGSGLVGIRRRAAALDGTLRVSSPPGGPTSIVVELPCGS